MVIAGSSVAILDTQMTEPVIAHAAISTGKYESHVMTKTEHTGICTPERPCHHSFMGIPCDEMWMTQPLKRPAMKNVEPAVLVL